MDHAVLLEHGLELAERLEGAAAADALVGGEITERGELAREAPPASVATADSSCERSEYSSSAVREKPPHFSAIISAPMPG